MNTITHLDPGGGPFDRGPGRQSLARPPGAGAPPSSVRRDRGTSASVHLRIQRLALDGFPLDSGQERTVRLAVEAELASLLATDHLPARLRTGGAAPRLPGHELRIGSWKDADDLGRKVARALYQGLHR